MGEVDRESKKIQNGKGGHRTKEDSGGKLKGEGKAIPVGRGNQGRFGREVRFEVGDGLWRGGMGGWLAKTKRIDPYKMTYFKFIDNEKILVLLQYGLC